jgi:hypothetical protein
MDGLDGFPQRLRWKRRGEDSRELLRECIAGSWFRRRSRRSTE